MVIAEDVHDVVRTMSAVEDVAQDVERIDGESLDQVTECNDEGIGTAGADDGIDNHFRICLLVRQHGILVQQFLDNVRELFRQRLAYLRAGIFGRNVLAYGHKLVQGSEIPAVDVCFYCLHQVELLFRIIDKRTKFLTFVFAERVAEDFIYFTLDGTGSISQYMLECFVFTMKVGQEVFRTFRQIDNGFQVDDFCTGSSYGRETA